MVNQKERVTSSATSSKYAAATAAKDRNKTINSQRSRAIKKPYVRFDDYLDLNEENMRRSCKRLMNRLYSEPNSGSVADQGKIVDVAQETEGIMKIGKSCCRSTSPPLLKHQQPLSQVTTNEHHKLSNSDQFAATNTKEHDQDSTKLTCLATTVTSTACDKSYLRLQYERRQKKKLEEMSKQWAKTDSQTSTDLNLTDNKEDASERNQNYCKSDSRHAEPGFGSNNNNIFQQQRQHQQDFVAKSHELSKRRFFERLEKRGSSIMMGKRENSAMVNLNTQNDQVSSACCNNANSSTKAFKQQVQQNSSPKTFPTNTIGTEQKSTTSAHKVDQKHSSNKQIAHRSSKDHHDHQNQQECTSLTTKATISNNNITLPRVSTVNSNHLSSTMEVRALMPTFAPSSVAKLTEMGNASFTEKSLKIAKHNDLCGPPLSLLLQEVSCEATNPIQTITGLSSSDGFYKPSSELPLANQLIGIHTKSSPTRQLSLGERITNVSSSSVKVTIGKSCESSVKTEEPLIEFNKPLQAGDAMSQEQSETHFSTNNEKDVTCCKRQIFNESAFEISVPEASLNSVNAHHSSNNKGLSVTQFHNELLVVEQSSISDTDCNKQTKTRISTSNSKYTEGRDIETNLLATLVSDETADDGSKKFISSAKPISSKLDNKMIVNSDGIASSQINDDEHHKEFAASSKVIEFDDDANLVCKRTIKLKYESTSINKQKRKSEDISSTISAYGREVNQNLTNDGGNNKSQVYGVADEMKKTTPTSSSFSETTSKPAMPPNKNNNNANKCLLVSSSSCCSTKKGNGKAQLQHDKELTCTCECNSHEAPEANRTHTKQTTDNTDTSTDNCLNEQNQTEESNKAIVSCDSHCNKSFVNNSLAAQIRQVEGEHVCEKVAATLNAAALFGAAENEVASSLKTIITNKRATACDVLPEASSCAGPFVKQQQQQQQPTPLNNSDLDAIEKKVAAQANANIGGRCCLIGSGKITNACEQTVDYEFVKEVESAHAEKKRERLSSGALAHDQQQVQQLDTIDGLKNGDEHDPLDKHEQYANPISVNAIQQNSDRELFKYSSENNGDDHEHCIDRENMVGNLKTNENHVNHVNHMVIEPFYKHAPSSILKGMRKQTNTNFQVVEERKAYLKISCENQTLASSEVGSSCSSSGFGASVSATSSASSCDGCSTTHEHCDRSIHSMHMSCDDKKLTIHTEQKTRKSNQVDDKNERTKAYDSVVDQMKALMVQSDQVSLSSEYKLVGPDQAYPTSTPDTCTLYPSTHVVENHGYASINRGNSHATNEFSAEGLQVEKVSATVGAQSNVDHYANWPLNGIKLQQQPSMVYAQVKTSSIDSKSPPTENKKYSSTVSIYQSQNLVESHKIDYDCSIRKEYSLDNSTTAITASIPRLQLSKPPTFTHINHQDINIHSLPMMTRDSHTSSNQSQQEIANTHKPKALVKKSPSLLKRFSCLVSRAFTTSGASELADAIDSTAQKACENLTMSTTSTTPQCLPEAGVTCVESKDIFSTQCNEQIVHDNNYCMTNAISLDSDNIEVINNVATVSSDKPKSSVEADLIILPTKNFKSNVVVANELNNSHRRHKNRTNIEHAKSGQKGLSHRSCREVRPRRNVEQKSHYHKKTNQDSLSPSVSCSSSLSSYSTTSLDNSSLIESSNAYGRLKKRFDRIPIKLTSRNVRRSSSLSDDLESLMSPSSSNEPSSRTRNVRNDTSLPKTEKILPRSSRERSRNHRNMMERFSIDCESPSLSRAEHDHIESIKSRSLLNWLNSAQNRMKTKTTHSGVSSSASRLNQSEVISKNIKESSISDVFCEPAQHESKSYRSLMEQNHAISDNRLNLDAVNEKRCHIKEKLQSKDDEEKATTLLYASVNKQSKSLIFACRPHHKSENNGNEQDDDHCHKQEQTTCMPIDATGMRFQSLNLSQNLVQNNVKRHHSSKHHRERHHHSRSNHSHNHHCDTNHKYIGRRSSSRHAQLSLTLLPNVERCGRQCMSTCSDNFSSLQQLAIDSSSRGKGKLGGRSNCLNKEQEKAGVWGQLIKISKSDGSQIIELQRAPNRSWGFFVARGAINNIKGIFISRVHDNDTSNSLTGLLSIGDRILSIDNCPIGQDFDILRVNQMISKKCKITLRVKPFKG